VQITIMYNMATYFLLVVLFLVRIVVKNSIFTFFTRQHHDFQVPRELKNVLHHWFRKCHGKLSLAHSSALHGLHYYILTYKDSCWWQWGESVSELRPLTGLLLSPKWYIYEFKEQQWSAIDRWKRITWRETCPSATPSITNPTWADPVWIRASAVRGHQLVKNSVYRS
jgi:hypothetical protein